MGRPRLSFSDGIQPVKNMSIIIISVIIRYNKTIRHCQLHSSKGSYSRYYKKNGVYSARYDRVSVTYYNLQDFHSS